MSKALPDILHALPPPMLLKLAICSTMSYFRECLTQRVHGQDKLPSGFLDILFISVRTPSMVRESAPDFGSVSWKSSLVCRGWMF
jgi:hypothetical protein